MFEPPPTPGPAGSLSETRAPRHNPYSAADVAAILRARGWLADAATPEILTWCEQAAALLGPQVESRAQLEELLTLVFHYDARDALAQPETPSVLTRRGARETLRALALELLEGPPVDSARLKEIAAKLREQVHVSSRALFHPLRLALVGRVGEGELDRVILLLDSAAALPFACPVKGTRQRILEFCAALD
ncbi:MAG: hypothetical protein K6U02_06135 [Firmicutes bacterium]|nr:hypothetical protein [Bacillota bacterium]